MGASAMREGLRRSIGRVGLAAVPLVVSAALLAAGAKFAIDDSAARDVAVAWAATDTDNDVDDGGSATSPAEALPTVHGVSENLARAGDAATWAAVTPSAHRAETTATRAPPAVSSSHNERALPARRDPESHRAFQVLLSSHPRSPDRPARGGEISARSAPSPSAVLNLVTGEEHP